MATSTPTKIGFATAPLAVVALLVMMLHGEEGRRYQAYRDSAGVWTVCAGITGPEVVQGRTYTDAECDILEVRYVDRMLARMGACVPGDVFEIHEVLAWSDFAYNVGTGAFCASTAANMLRAGKYGEACQQVARWRFITLPDGRKVDGSTPGNKTCAGLWDRRQRVIAKCEGRG